MNVSVSGATVTGSSGGAYNVRVTTSGEANVNVTAKENTYIQKIQSKNDTDPVAVVEVKRRTIWSAAEMRVQNGLAAMMGKLRFRCKI